MPQVDTSNFTLQDFEFVILRHKNPKNGLWYKYQNPVYYLRSLEEELSSKIFSEEVLEALAKELDSYVNDKIMHDEEKVPFLNRIKGYSTKMLRF